jgi:hypothetical protein
MTAIMATILRICQTPPHLILSRKRATTDGRTIIRTTMRTTEVRSWGWPAEMTREWKQPRRPVKAILPLRQPLPPSLCPHPRSAAPWHTLANLSARPFSHISRRPLTLHPAG